jgi:hypothetical protein
MQPKLRRLIEPVLRNREYKQTLEKALRTVGYEPTDWVRTVMYRECYKLIQALGPETLDVLEISAGERFSGRFRFRSFTTTQFPEFDICSQVLPKSFDLIIADQVFEHLKWPYRAGKNVHAMLRSGGHFLVATPFLIRVHNVPIDCSRWTELGLKCLLEECGFPEASIKTESWGNRACVRSNLYHWAKTGWFGSLKSEPDFPVMVWALAEKTN